MVSFDTVKDPRPSLLSIPREVRDEIYGYIADFNCESPAGFTDYIIQEDFKSFPNNTVPITIHQPRPPWLLLGLCSRQLHDEISQFISKKADRKPGMTIDDTPGYELTFRIDAGNFGKYIGSRLSLSWIKVPTLPIRYSKCIRLNFLGASAVSLHNVYPDGNHGHALLRCLANFFAYGASFPSENAAARPPVWVEELRIIMTNSDSTNGYKPGYPQEQFDKVLGSVVLAGLLYGKVGRICLLQAGTIDGGEKLVHQWDIWEYKNIAKPMQRWKDDGWIYPDDTES
ncbi:MAG: hypothetical protein Q9170_005755 [Blastenia crenularia]